MPQTSVFEVVYMVKGDLAPNRSHLDLPSNVTMEQVRAKLAELLQPHNKQLVRVTALIEQPHKEGRQ